MGKKKLVFFLMHYFTLEVHRRLLECHFLGLRMLKNPKKPISKNCNIFEKNPKGRLTMLKSPKLINHKRGFVLRIRHGGGGAFISLS